jgi:hypothetical protein
MADGLGAIAFAELHLFQRVVFVIGAACSTQITMLDPKRKTPQLPKELRRCCLKMCVRLGRIDHVADVEEKHLTCKSSTDTFWTMLHERERHHVCLACPDSFECIFLRQSPRHLT